jgi:signal transduction histidine kinase
VLRLTRSLRGRVTLVAAAVAAAMLIPAGVGTIGVAKIALRSSIWESTKDVAEQVVARYGVDGIRPGTVLPSDSSVDLIQVVAPDGKVVAASPAARGRPRLSDVWPGPGTRVLSTTQCYGENCVHLTAVRAGAAPSSRVVYAARPVTSPLNARIVEAAVFLQIAALVALATWYAWLIMGRALRPVGTMLAELDQVNAGDPSARVTEPTGEDEIARLARCVNSTLARLERSTEQQRQFASDASHELRTPIAGLRAQLESAQLYPDDTDVEALVESTLRDTDRLEAIITDLLLLARIGSRVDVAKERMDLGDLVRDELSGRTDKLPVRAVLDEGVMVEGVRLQVARALTNLLDNAQRHAEHTVRVEVTTDDGFAVLAVENDGVEICPEDRERIFERFTRLDAARSRDAGGTGLGLAIARDVAVAHRGHIQAEDYPGGARFVLRLPLA